MPDFIDKDAFLHDVLPDCKYPNLLISAVEKQPIVHIDDLTFRIQNELQVANPSGIVEINFVRHGRWIDNGEDKFICSNCNGYVYRWFGRSDFCPRCGAKMDGGAKE